MPERNFTAVRTDVSWGPEWNHVFSLTNWALDAVVSDHRIVRIAANHKWAAHVPSLEGAYVIVLNGVNEGIRLHIIEAGYDATVAYAQNTDWIEFEEDTSVDWAAFAATDRIAIFQHGHHPSDIEDWDTSETVAGQLLTFFDTSEYLGLIDDSELPDWSQEVGEIFSHGDDLPNRRVAIPNTLEAATSITLKPVNGRLLFYPLGYVKEDGTATGGGVATTLGATEPTYPGEAVITVAAAGALQNADWILIGDNAGGVLNEGAEMRQINGVPVGNVLTLNAPLRRYHPGGAAVVETDVTAPITHTMDGHLGPSLWTINIEARYHGYSRYTSADDNLFHILGVYPTKWDISGGNDSELEVSLDVTALDIVLNDVAASTVDDSDYNNEPYHYRMGEVTIGGVQYRQMESVKISAEKGGTLMRYHNYETGHKPFEFIPGRMAYECEVTVPYHQPDLWNALRNFTQQTVSMEYVRGANDTITMAAVNTYMSEGSVIKLPAEAEIPQDITFSPQNVTVVVVDDIPMY